MDFLCQVDSELLIGQISYSLKAEMCITSIMSINWPKNTILHIQERRRDEVHGQHPDIRQFIKHCFLSY